MASMMSIFDPSSSLPFLNISGWVVVTLPMIWVKSSFWHSYSSVGTMFKTLIGLLVSGFKSNSLLFAGLFMFILEFNFFGLLPLVFSPTSHLSFNLTLSLTLWLGMMLWYVRHNLNNLLTHLTPLGCPMALVPFMVIIELVSSLIRPLTLGMRLMANVMAGHMVLSLISSSVSVSYSGSLMMVVLMGFTLFEMGVAVIQAYVFSSLMDLYWKESEDH